MMYKPLLKQYGRGAYRLVARMMTVFVLVFLFIQPALAAKVRTGVERLDEYKWLFAGKRVGLITNATGVDSRLKDSATILAEKTNLVAIFSPEHGYLGQVVAGQQVGSQWDERLGVPVRSLYGATRKPTPEQLKDIDVLVFDIQDIGVRNYTYLSTMAYALQACAEQKKKFVVLDRPNPLGGAIEGPVLKPGFESFIGVYPIPFRHGLTPGEAARFYNREFGLGADLTVIPMTGWHRGMYFEDTGLPWVMTSPNIPTPDSVWGYAVTGAFSGLNISNGVGTTRPFELVGAPWVDPWQLSHLLEQENLPGVIFRPMAFIPRFGGHSGNTCYGVQIHVADKRKFNAVETGFKLFYILRRMAGVGVISQGSANRLDRNLGENSVWDNEPLDELLSRWRTECNEFARKVKPYLLYGWR